MFLVTGAHTQSSINQRVVLWEMYLISLLGKMI